MKGSYIELNKMRDIINSWQQNDFVHPLTCGNDSQRHDILKTQLTLINEKSNEFELMIVCDDCNWKQDVPIFFIENKDKFN